MKRIVAKTGSYQKNGETKNEWTTIGVILSNDNGEYVLLDPKVNLAGVHTAQMMNDKKEGKNPSTRIMASVFVQDGQQGQGGGYAGQQQGGGQGGYGQGQQQPNSRDLEDSIPF